MTRPTLKTSLVALSLAATLGGWAVLAQQDVQHNGQPIALAPEPVVQSIELAPIPTVARPPASGAEGISAPGVAPLELPPIPDVSAPAAAPRPIARTRSSR